MKRSSLSSSFAIALTLGTLTLAGCGGALNMPDSVMPAAQASGPAIAGKVFGGHAPIQGAHVYLLQPGTAGYGSIATSILGNNGTASNPALTTNSTQKTPDPQAPPAAQFVTTDDTGSFNLTGLYSCTPNQPVYIYSYGGNIGTTTGTTTTPTTVTLNITAAADTGNNNNRTYTFTAANPAATPLVAGDTVTIVSLTSSGPGNSGHWEDLDGDTFTVVMASATQFTVMGTRNTNGSATGTATFVFNSSTTTTTPPTQNPSSVELVTLGNCPNNGAASVDNFSTGNTAINFIYMNEVSTVATAYTFQPFTLPANNDAWHIGTSGTTQALQGIANAANTAAQLYAIQGSTQISTTDDGEGHLANFATQGADGTPNQGNGLVPQSTIDSLANVLAACIDSVPTSSAPTTICKALFKVATDDGTTTGTQPTDTATAAINIARYPAGNNSSGAADPTYASDIWALQGSPVPYAPDLNAAPNDWTIAINYPETAVANFPQVTNNLLGRAESIAVDKNGDVWITAQTDDEVVRWSPLGAQQATNDLGYIPGYVSLDGSGNAWTGNANSTSGIFEAGNNGVFTTLFGSGYQQAYVTIADQGGDVFFFATTSDTTTNPNGNFEMFEYPSGASTSSTPNVFSVSPSIITAGDNAAHGALDAAGDFWITTENPGNQITRFSVSGTSTVTKAFSMKVAEQPEFPAIDHNGNAWIPIQATDGEIELVTPTGSVKTLTAATTGARLSSTFGAAVDGNGNVWITNRSGNFGSVSNDPGTNTIVEINGTGVINPATSGPLAGAGTAGTINTAISPANNYVPETEYSTPTKQAGYTTMLNDSLNVAIDPSGNVWTTNYLGNAVVELVGAAAPVVTPLSVAAGNNELGVKP